MRVVVTGLGTVNPLGNDVLETWKRMTAGESGIGRLSRFDPTHYGAGSDFPKIAGEVKDSVLSVALPPKHQDRFDRVSQFAVSSAREAMLHSGLGLDFHDRQFDTGVILGSSFGNVKTLQDVDRSLLSGEEGGGIEQVPYNFMTSGLAAGLLSHLFCVAGPTYTVNAACASGGFAIAQAFDMISSGRLNICIAGGSEACLTPSIFGGFDTMRVLSRENQHPAKASRPFDSRRSGFVMSEGAAILVLESLGHAQRRKADILAELVGCGVTSNVTHLINPTDGTLNIAMEMAMEQGKIFPIDVGYVNAHATGTRVGDVAEADAIKSAFEGRFGATLVGANKSMTGHLLGASGALEAVLTVLTLGYGVIPPNTNLEYADPKCNLPMAPSQAVEGPIKCALSNSLGFGGVNVCLAFKRFE